MLTTEQFEEKLKADIGEIMSGIYAVEIDHYRANITKAYEYGEISEKQWLSRIDMSNDSNYMKSLETLKSIKEITNKDNEVGLYDDDYYANLKKMARYIFKSIEDGNKKYLLMNSNISYTDTKTDDYLKKFKMKSESKVITGFKQFDSYTQGITSGLCVIGALSSLGKTSFCSQIADQIANNNNKVIFYSREMQPEEIWAKSICRISADEKISITYNDIVNHHLNNDMRLSNSITNSISIYNQKIGKNLMIKTVKYGWEQTIRQDIISIIESSNDSKSPVIIIDYLQLLPPPKSCYNKANRLDVMNSVIDELKQIINTYNCTIIAISSLNRNSYNKPISLESFKESGAIEYSSELVLGLQPMRTQEVFNETLNEYNADNVRAWKAKDIKDIELVILKNRNGKTGASFNFGFKSSFFKFNEIRDKSIDYSI